MHIYIAYKYTGADKEKLKQLLVKISNRLEENGHSTFIYFRDSKNWEKREGYIPLDRVILESAKEIKMADALLAIVQDNEKSEGMLIDIGCAIGMNKTLFLAIKEGCSLPKTEKLASKTIIFSDTEELVSKLKI